MIRYFLLFILAVPLWQPHPAQAQQFDHAIHVTVLADEGCRKCHVPEARAITPAREICAECHEDDFLNQVAFPGLKTHGPVWALRHGREARNSIVNCGACHRQHQCLDCHKSGFADEMGALGNHFINVHRGDFHVSHPLAARTDQRLCGRCHETRFCADCHATFNNADLAVLSHRKGWSSITVAGAPHAAFAETSCETCHRNSVLPAHEWSSVHSREARKNLATCQTCHPDGDICLKCHSATSGLRVNPHPADWGNRMAGRLEAASGGRTCGRCH